MTVRGSARAAEQGSGTVVALAGISVLLMLLGVVHLVSASAVAAAQSARAADLAALAAADVARGLAPGDPCTTAGQVAERNGAVLTSCSVGGEFDTEVTVEVSRDVLTETAVGTGWLGLPELPATGISRAGPPEALAQPLWRP